MKKSQTRHPGAQIPHPGPFPTGPCNNRTLFQTWKITNFHIKCLWAIKIQWVLFFHLWPLKPRAEVKNAGQHRRPSFNTPAQLIIFTFRGVGNRRAIAPTFAEISHQNCFKMKVFLKIPFLCPPPSPFLDLPLKSLASSNTPDVNF